MEQSGVRVAGERVAGLGDGLRVYARAVTTSYTTLLNSDPLAGLPRELSTVLKKDTLAAIVAWRAERLICRSAPSSR